jgi:endonuclease/exonuclease/phosphatase family metal-dependent hydrolase
VTATAKGSTVDGRATRRPLRILCWTLILLFAVVTVLRLLGVAHGWLLVTALAFTPYLAVASLLPLILSLLLRRWRAALAAFVVCGALALCVLPRATGDPQRPAGGPALVVASANLRVGQADAGTLVALVRNRGVDLLALQEYTPAAQAGLHAAGLDDVLSYRVAYPLDGVGGSALYSRYPLTDGGYRPLPPFFGQAYGTLHVPGSVAVQVESAHPCAPSDPSRVPDWRHDLAVEPAASPHGTVRILLGDFNATLDHGPLRHLLSTGYQDAASTVGAGLTPTWPYDGRPVPRVTLDHVLVDPRVSVQSFATAANPGSDHRAITARLSLPRA